MIANAGIAQVKALLDLTEDDVRRMFEVNVFGGFNCYSAAAKQMIKQGTGGKLVGCARYLVISWFIVMFANRGTVLWRSSLSPCFLIILTYHCHQ